MKNTIVRIRRMSLMLFTALALCSSSLVAQNYTYEVKNDQVIDATHFRFDIYMKVNSGTVNYRSSQFTLWISQGFVNGSASVAYVSGSSDISAGNIFGAPVYTTATAGGVPPGTGSDTSVIKINSTSLTCPGYLLGTTAVRWGTFEVTRTGGGSWGCGSNKLGFYTGQTIGNKVTSNIQVWTACPSTGVTLPIANGTYTNSNLNNQTPVIAAQPRDTSICENAGTATFSVSVTNSNPGSPISYHWKENGSPLSDGGVYGGVLTSSLTITNPSVLLNGKSYTCDVSQCNTITSSPGILTVNSPDNINLTAAIACDSYNLPWGGSPVTTTGDYTSPTYSNIHGCDSVIHQHVTINHGTHNASTVSQCNSYTWTGGTGTTYTVSGTYLYPYNNVDNCSSTDTLRLTINYSTHNVSTVSQCNSYTWTGGTGTTYTVSGMYLYNYSNGDGCASTDTLHLTINNGTYNASTISQCNSYTWSGGTGTTYTTSGTYLYNYNNGDGCASTDTLHLTINNSTHNASTISQCNSYTWTSGTGITYTTSGTYLYNYNNGNGCASTDTLHLTINSIVVTATPSAPIQCFGYSTCVDVSATGGSGIYIDGTGQVCGYSAGDYTFTVTDNNGCSGTSGNINISEPDKIEGTVSVTPEICAGSNGTATVNPTGGSGTYVSYSWNSSPVQSTQTATGLAAGNYVVTIADDNGCSGTATAVVGSLGTPPATPSAINGSAGACKGQSGLVYSVVNVPGMTYIWTLPAGASGSSSTNSITVNFSNAYAGGFICVKASNGCGMSGQVCIPVPVITGRPGFPSAPSGPSISVCGPTTVTYSIPPVANATSYSWSVTGTGLSLATGQGTTSITVNVAAGFVSGRIGVYASSCSGVSGENSLFIYGMLSGQIQQAIFPNVGVCGGSTYTYAITPFNGATSITWTAPTGALINGISNPLTTAGNVFSVNITFPVGFVSGNVSVFGGNGCGNGTTRTVAVRATPAQPAFISGPISGLCGQTGIVYSTTGTAGATSYTWSVPSGVTITNTSPDQLSITVNFTAAFTGSNNICVTPFSACGAGIQRCLSITSRPDQPGTLSGSASVCKSSSAVAYSVPAVAGVTYTWSVTGGATVIGAGANATVNFTGATSNSVILSVVASNTCGNAVSPRSLVISVNLGCRTTNETDVASELIAYPNPAHNKLYVMFNSIANQDYTISIYDMTGRKVGETIESDAAKNMHELDLTDFAKGMYLLEVRTRGEKQIVRIGVE